MPRLRTPWSPTALVASAVAAIASSAFVACAAGNEEELGQNGPPTSSASSSGAGGTGTTSSSSGGAGGGAAGGGPSGGGGATGGAGGNGQGGDGGLGGGEQGGGGNGQGGGGGGAPTGTVLLVATGGAQIFAGELHPPSSWSSTTLSETSGHAPALAFDAAGGALALVRSQANGGELRHAAWSAGTWSPFAAVAAGVTTQARPALVSLGGALGAVFHGDDFKHYFASYQAGSWSPTAEPIGSPQSFGPSAPSLAATASPLTVFAGNDGDLYDQPRSGGVWQPAVGHGLGNLVQLSPAAVAMTAGVDVLVVFVRKTDAKIAWTTRTGAVWTAPSELDPNSFSADPVALTALPGGDAVAAFRGLDGKAYASRYTFGASPPWSAPAPIANPNYSIASSPSLAPGVAGVDAELAFVDSNTSQAFHARLQGTTWSAPVAVGGSGLVNAAIASAP